MSKLVFFRAQVKLGMPAGARPAGNSLNYSYARALQLLYLVRIIRKQPQFANSESLQRLGRKFVIARIRREAKLPIGLHCVEPRVLQLVRLQFIDQPDAAPLLRQIQQHPRRCLRDLPQRKFKLRPAIAALRRKHISRQALRMDPHQRSPSSQIASLDCNSLFARIAPGNPEHRESPKTRGQLRPRHHPRAISSACRGSLCSFARLFRALHQNWTL